MPHHPTITDTSLPRHFYHTCWQCSEPDCSKRCFAEVLWKKVHFSFPFFVFIKLHKFLCTEYTDVQSCVPSTLLPTIERLTRKTNFIRRAATGSSLASNPAHLCVKTPSGVVDQTRIRGARSNGREVLQIRHSWRRCCRGTWGGSGFALFHNLESYLTWLRDFDRVNAVWEPHSTCLSDD